jgi:multiple sugar transport system permease protein
LAQIGCIAVHKDVSLIAPGHFALIQSRVERGEAQQIIVAPLTQNSLDDAGLLDGASYFRIYFSIILPLLKPAIVTLAVIKGIGVYNDFYIPNIYLIRGAQTLTVALYRFFSGLSTPFEVVSAAVLLATIPMLALFLFCQRYIYNGLAGLVKY